MSYFRNGDLVQAVNTGETLRFGPGVLIPWTSGQSYAQDILDQIGRDVGALDFDWPAPYDGEARRAKVRLLEKARRMEEYVAGLGIWATRQSAHFKLYPWQERLYEALQP